MVVDFLVLNDSGVMGCFLEVFEKSWLKDMIWYGFCGIGVLYIIFCY